MPFEPVPANRPRIEPPVRSRGTLGILLALGALVLTKGKSLLLLLKALPAGKLFLTTGSMLAMVWFEAMRSGIWFAIGFVLLILVHELGHGYAMKRSGIESGWPIFIPFFGAMIAMKGAATNRHVEATIAYGGPLAGTAAALVCAGLGFLTGERLFLALAYFGFFLNLFNLTPLSPLDGGGVAQAFSRRAWIVGVVVIASVFFVTGAPLLLVIGLLALPRLLSRNTEPELDPLAPAEQRLWAVRYFGLCAFLAIAMYFSGQLLGRS